MARSALERELARTRARARTRTLYEGPVGSCPCCGRPTEIRIAGTLSTPDRPWVVPESVLRTVYSEVSRRTREKDGNLHVVEPGPYDATKRLKLLFVEGGAGLAGPFSHIGLLVFLRTALGDAGTEDTRVYVVTTTSRALEIIRRSPFAAPPPPEPEVEGAEGLF